MMKLSAQQREVVHLISRGLSNKQIAHDLGIVEASIKAHASLAMRKNGFHNRVQLAVAYVRETEVVRSPLVRFEDVVGPPDLMAGTREAFGHYIGLDRTAP